MHIRLISVGKLKEGYLTQAVSDYIKRIKPFSSIILEEIKEAPLSSDPKEEEIQKALAMEGKDILAKIQPKDFVVVLDLMGKSFDSLSLAQSVENWLSKASSFVFIIGSSFGLSPEVKQKASIRWALSPLTFPHGIVRLLVLEQLYRTFKINAHQTYHK